MNTKISLLITAFLCSISSVLIAQSVSVNEAKTIAGRHLANVRQKSLKSASSLGNSFRPTSVKATVENKDTLYYILNDTINKSFAIVSADKRAWPILGYSTEGCFNENKQPEAFIAWMENRKKEIVAIKLNNLQPDNATITSWQNLSVSTSTAQTPYVEPLIQTQWDQGCFYNAMCPADAAGPCGHVPTGCTITAMAQIMKYWNYPTKGTGSHSYSHPTYGNLSADFGSTTYQWSKMPNSVTSQNDAVATLMYHCGVSLDAEYNTFGTGAWDPRDALVQYFNYSSKAMLVNKSGFATGDWIQLLKSELDLGHPIWYMGSSLVGHAFICDGYQDADYFHFNWGWSGSSDGYFYLGNLNPSWYNYNENQFALLNLVPGDLPDGYNGVFLSLNDLDITTMGGTASVDICSSANWTASSDQTWFSLSTSSGISGKTTITITAPENQTGNDRSATIKISAAGFGTQSITVNQLAKVNVTAGALYNLIANKTSRITQLTLTGTIDARDFKTMRDAMPALTAVDMSEVTIVSYTGTEGPCNLENKTYPANEIPDAAFSLVRCRGKIYLEEFILPKSIKSIGVSSFIYCSYLTKINILASVVNIGDLAFESCNAMIYVDKANPNYSSIDGVLFDKKETNLIYCPTSKKGNYSIPSSVTSIKHFAFESCNKLSSINIPSSVRFIEEPAFWDCSASIVVEENNLNYSGSGGVLFNKDQTALICCPISKKGIYIVPSSVGSIEQWAFYHCAGLTDISMPTSINFIGNGAFNGCNKLTSITIPSSVIYIGDQAFYSCKGLLDLTIPLSIKSIGFGAFSYCSNLSSIHAYPILPIDLNSSSDVFMDINKNTCTLYVPFRTRESYQAANQWKDFMNIVEMPGIFLSKSSMGIGPIEKTTQVAITSSSNWTAKSDQTWLTINPSNGITGTGTITFNVSENPATDNRVATVTISGVGIASQTITVTQYSTVDVTTGNLKAKLGGQLATITSISLSGTIDARDFKTMRDEMPALADIDLSGVTIVAYSGTEGTDNNSSIYAANCVPNYAFHNYNTGQGKTVLRSIILPLSVTSIGSLAFFGCINLNSINIPSSVTSIEFLAFSNCTGLSTINIPASVERIDKTAFNYFAGTITVDENNSVYSAIDGVLFNKIQKTLIKCPVSKSGDYTVPSSVTSIQNNAFTDCHGLTNVTIPSSVNSLGDHAFSFCINLTSIITHRKIPIYLDSSSGLQNSSIGVFEFIDKNKCTLYVPYGSKAAYQAANQWKDFANIVEMPGIKLSATSVNLKSASGSTGKIDISANVAYSVVSDQTWLTVGTATQTEASILTFTATENTGATQRTALVTVSSAGVETQTITVTQDAKNTTGIDRLSSSPQFKAYPNPTNGKIKLVFDQVPVNGILVTISDVTGKICLKQLIQNNEEWIDLSRNIPGIYLIKTNQENLKTQKIILK